MEEHHNEASQSKTRDSNRLYGGVALVVVLLLGIGIGYLFSQAWALPDTPAQQVVVTATPNPNDQGIAQSGELSPQASTPRNSATAAPGNDADALSTPTIMDFVLSDARHFQGNPDAPVTIVEYSDFK